MDPRTKDIPPERHRLRWNGGEKFQESWPFMHRKIMMSNESCEENLTLGRTIESYITLSKTSFCN